MAVHSRGEGPESPKCADQMTRDTEKAAAERPERDQERETPQRPGIHRLVDRIYAESVAGHG